MLLTMPVHAQDALGTVDQTETSAAAIVVSTLRKELACEERGIRGLDAVANGRAALGIPANGDGVSKSRFLLMHTTKWSTFYDYGTDNTPEDVFSDLGSCERDARQKDAEDRIPDITGEGRAVSHYACEAIETPDEESWVSRLIARRNCRFAQNDH